jgi:hypothetical protein
MRANNGCQLDDREGIQNTRRDPIQADEDQAIEVAEDRALRRPSVQYVQLMAQSQVLCPKRCSRPEQPDEYPPDQIEQVTHGQFIARFGASRQADGIYDSDTPPSSIARSSTASRRCSRSGASPGQSKGGIHRIF